MRKIALIAAAVLGVVLATGLAWAVLLTLDPENVARIGGTGQVNVYSPDADETVESVTWVLNTTDYTVTGANVEWTPADTGTFVVAVQVYGQSGNLLTSGSATVNVDNTTIVVGQQTTTTVTFANSVYPEDIYYVRVVIYQTTVS